MKQDISFYHRGGARRVSRLQPLPQRVSLVLRDKRPVPELTFAIDEVWRAEERVRKAERRRLAEEEQRLAREERLARPDFSQIVQQRATDEDTVWAANPKRRKGAEPD